MPRRTSLFTLTALSLIALAAIALVGHVAGAQAAPVAPPAAAPAPRAEFVAANGTAPLSQFVRVGETVYLSGVLGTGPDGALAAGGIAAETRQAMTNLGAALARAGATPDDVVKCTVFLADMQEWGAMNEVYATFFPRHKPARSAVGVNGLARNARVEIECLAVRGAGGR
jgi:2-iminobutanoate/2-iminopropanoate deaminase